MVGLPDERGGGGLVHVTEAGEAWLLGPAEPGILVILFFALWRGEETDGNGTGGERGRGRVFDLSNCSARFGRPAQLNPVGRLVSANRANPCSLFYGFEPDTRGGGDRGEGRRGQED